MRVEGRGDRRALGQQGPSSKWPQASSRSYKSLEHSEDDDDTVVALPRYASEMIPYEASQALEINVTTASLPRRQHLPESSTIPTF